MYCNEYMTGLLLSTPAYLYGLKPLMKCKNGLSVQYMPVQYILWLPTNVAFHKQSENVYNIANNPRHVPFFSSSPCLVLNVCIGCPQNPQEEWE